MLLRAHSGRGRSRCRRLPETIHDTEFIFVLEPVNGFVNGSNERLVQSVARRGTCEDRRRSELEQERSEPEHGSGTLTAESFLHNCEVRIYPANESRNGHIEEVCHCVEQRLWEHPNGHRHKLFEESTHHVFDCRQAGSLL